jgi:hypothetical protein
MSPRRVMSPYPLFAVLLASSNIDPELELHYMQR